MFKGGGRTSSSLPDSATKQLTRHQCAGDAGNKEALEKRADRALDLVQMGELSAARHALEGDPIAPGSQHTLHALQDPNRRPPVPRSPLPPAILNHVPKVEFDLSQEGLLADLRSARRGAAGGPSGMTTDHIRVILDSERDSKSFWRMCQEFARGRLPEEILRVVRIGRMTALQKPQGGIRGIVVGDVVRRLVARTLAQQMGPAVERHTSPFQFALSTKSGCECVAHIAQAMTDLDPTTTLLSVDGIGAFDLISREAMLQGLLEVEGGGGVLPFVRQFYSSPSMYWWTDDEGGTHEIWQGEGGEQGDPLMPALYACGQHQALVHVSEQLLDSERLFAFMDDVYVCCGPDRVEAIHLSLEQEMWDHTRIQLTKEKPSCGIEEAPPLKGGRQ